MARIGVLGGGISGLSLAYFLARAGLPTGSSITLLEASSRFGGWVHSKPMSLPDGRRVGTHARACSLASALARRAAADSSS